VAKPSSSSKPGWIASGVDFTFLLLARVILVFLDAVHTFILGVDRERAAPTPAWRQQHAGAAVNAVLDDDEVVVFGKLVFVYAVQAPLLGRAAHTVTVPDQTGIRLLAAPAPSGIDGVMVLGNVQVQEMLVGEVVVAVDASVHVGLEVVDVVVVERGKVQGLVGRQRALDDGRRGFPVSHLPVERGSAGRRCASVAVCR